MFGMINVVAYDGTDAYCMKFIAEIEIEYSILEDIHELVPTEKTEELITNYCERCGAEAVKFDVKHYVSHGFIMELKESGTAEEKAAVDRFEQLYF